MKLHFHGGTYEDRHTEIEVTEGEIGGHYRGTPWRMHRLLRKQQLRHNNSSELKYRGIPYTKE
jgi:hypothetical protein